MIAIRLVFVLLYHPIVFNCSLVKSLSLDLFQYFYYVKVGNAKCHEIICIAAKNVCSVSQEVIVTGAGRSQ